MWQTSNEFFKVRIWMKYQNLIFRCHRYLWFIKIFRCVWAAPPRPITSSLICIIHFTSYRASFNYCFKTSPWSETWFWCTDPPPLSKNRRRALPRFLLRVGVKGGGTLSVHRPMDLFLVEWQLWVDRVVTKILSRLVDTKSRRGIKQLGISFGSIFPPFSLESSRGHVHSSWGKSPPLNDSPEQLLSVGA